jgi:hypothetical protein
VIGGLRSLSGDGLTTAARQGQKSTASHDQARQSNTDDGAWDRNGKQLGSDLSTGVLGGVDVKIRKPAFDPRDQRCLGPRDRSALGRDKLSQPIALAPPILAIKLLLGC